MNSLLNNQAKQLPTFDDPKDLSTRFARFYTNKISDIRSDLDNDPDKPDILEFSDSCPVSCVPLNEFAEMSTDEVRKVISGSSNASCILDNHPTWLLKQHVEEHLPAITAIVNKSLLSGIFPSVAHRAIVTPLIKKPSLDKEVLKNYRPVSNLSFVAKVIEKSAATQLVEHLNVNSFSDPLQSAYRALHSTETALIKVLSDIIADIDSRRAAFIVLLDMSAAFDTVDHKILLNRLKERFGIFGTAYAWFESYLHGWASQVSISGILSDPVTANFGVPQGSVLGPLLFTCYSNPIGDIVRSFSLRYHAYADDLQIYASFDPRIPGDMEKTVTNITECIVEIRKWLSANYLKLNDSKSEFFITGSYHSLKQVDTSRIELAIGDSKIKISPVIRNLGCFLDSNMSLTAHIDNLRKSILFHVRNLWRIRRFIDEETCHHAVRALVTSRLDYCNALFTILSAKDIGRLQRLQNSAARLVFSVGRMTEAAPLLQTLHWLPIQQRITFKVLLYVFKAFNNLAPPYIAELFTVYIPSRCLRSAMDKHRLVVPRSHLLIGDRAFVVAAAKAWNSLPLFIRTSNSIQSFKCNLKTHLF